MFTTYEINLFLKEQIILINEINVRDYFIRISVLIACFPTKLYKYQIFLSWRLFLSFADSLKILGGGLFLLRQDDGVGAHFLCSNELHNRNFSRWSHYKIFSVHLFNQSKLPL